MNTMNMPGFTAEVSLCKNKSDFRCRGHEIGYHSGQVVLPQLPKIITCKLLANRYCHIFDSFGNEVVSACRGGYFDACMGEWP